MPCLDGKVWEEDCDCDVSSGVFWIGRTFECDEGLRCMYVHHR